MTWLAVPTNSASDPRTKRLARLLGISKAEALGRVIALKCWSFEFAPDGDLSQHPDDVVADASMEWLDDPEVFVKSLIDSGWLDDKRQIRDWYETAGQFIDKREKNRQRMQRARAVHMQDTFDARAGATGHTGHTGPDIPDRTYPPKSPRGDGRSISHPVERTGWDGDDDPEFDVMRCAGDMEEVARLRKEHPRNNGSPES